MRTYWEHPREFSEWASNPQQPASSPPNEFKAKHISRLRKRASEGEATTDELRYLAFSREVPESQQPVHVPRTTRTFEDLRREQEEASAAPEAAEAPPDGDAFLRHIRIMAYGVLGVSTSQVSAPSPRRQRCLRRPGRPRPRSTWLRRRNGGVQRHLRVPQA